MFYGYSKRFHEDLITYLKAEREEMIRDGLIPTLDELVLKLEARLTELSDKEDIT